MDQKKHREMMPRHEKMREEQKVQDAEIEKLQADMNAATGEKRIDAIVAVVNKLIEQRKTMHEKMAALLDWSGRRLEVDLAQTPVFDRANFA
jgi:predicted phage gp36 major capsid-like protein